MDRLEILSNIQSLTDKFNETGFFPYAMQVFCSAHSNGLPVPKEVLDAIANGFSEWSKHDGRKPFEEIYKLKPGKGNKNIYAPGWKIARNKKLFAIMAKLMFLGWSERDALEAASRWLEEQYTANPEKYRWLKHSNAGRKGDGGASKEELLSPDAIRKEKNNNKQSFEESEREAAQSLLFMNDSKKQATESFYLELIGTKIEKGNPKTERELLEILVS